LALQELGVVGAVAGNDRRLPFLDSSVDFFFAGAPSTTRRPASAHKSVANEQDQWARTHGVEKKEGGRGIDGHFSSRADSDPRWSDDLACHASKSGKNVKIFSLPC